MNARIEAVSSRLPAKTAALVVAPHHLLYLTGFPSGDSYLLITRDTCCFLTDFRYIELAQRTVTGAECRCITRLSETLGELAGKHGLQEILLEAGYVTQAFTERLRTALPTVAFTPSGDLDRWLADLRLVKGAEELRKMEQAQALTEAGFDHIVSFIREGMTEREIALELEFFIRRQGAERVAFDFIVVSGKNGALPHGIPTEKRVERGDFITMDFGAVVDGYHSDMTRTVAVGAVSDEQRQVYQTVLDAQKAALNTLKAGILCKDGDAAARRVIESAGYGAYFGHATGHGVGVEIHEEPRLSAASEQTLEAGQVVTVEPGIYLTGRFGVRIEDMVLITEDGYRNFTHSPKELLLIN